MHACKPPYRKDSGNGVFNLGNCAGGSVDAAQDALDGGVEARRDAVQHAGQNLRLANGGVNGDLQQ
jgi:hypothetical protein